MLEELGIVSGGGGGGSSGEGIGNWGRRFGVRWMKWGVDNTP